MGAREIDDVLAWQLANEFKLAVYDLLRKRAEAATDLRYHDQLRSAAASAAMNIAEGFYRYNARDFARYLSIALASLGEAAMWVQDGIDRGYFTVGECRALFELAGRCRATTLRFRAALLASADAGKTGTRLASAAKSRRPDRPGRRRTDP